MAQFDIISAASKAYKTSWAERQYLLRLAAAPFFIKLVCFILAARFAAGEEQYLRFMLIMVPGFLAEGWMLSHYTRLIVIGHRWPFQATGDFDADMAVLSVRARGVLSGMIVYTLINMAVGLLVAVAWAIMLPYMPDDNKMPVGDLPPQIALFSIFMLGFVLWGFRLMWIYIPYAVNARALDYLKAVRGIGSSIHMIGIWLLCLVPTFLMLQVGGGFLGGFAAATLGTQASSFIMLLLTVIADTIKSLLTTAGMTYALVALFEKNKNGE